jgi:hypothetical protein
VVVATATSALKRKTYKLEVGGSLIGAVGDCKIPLLSAYENDVLPYTTFEFKLKAGLMVVESRLG